MACGSLGRLSERNQREVERLNNGTSTSVFFFGLRLSDRHVVTPTDRSGSRSSGDGCYGPRSDAPWDRGPGEGRTGHGRGVHVDVCGALL